MSGGNEAIADEEGGLLLLCRVRSRLCALPLAHVVETMRPQRIEPVPGAPPFVRGLAIIRGVPTPVLDVARLIGTEGTRPGRFVTVIAGDRVVALAVDSVIGVRSIPTALLHELSPLFGDVPAEIVAAVGTLDDELLFVLRSTRLVPEALWTALDATGLSA